MSATPYLPAGTVYGTLLNFPREWDAWEGPMEAPPYKAAPLAPVLYIKTANTWSTSGADIALPGHVPQVEIGATIALVFGENVPPRIETPVWNAMNYVAHWVLLNDLSVPHASFFRPPVKFKCLDGFLGIGQPRARQPGDDPSQFRVEVRVNKQRVQTLDFSQLRRAADQLVADVREFQSLEAGDVLMLGCDVCPDGKRPLAHVGDVIEISAPGFVPLTNSLVAA